MMGTIRHSCWQWRKFTWKREPKRIMSQPTVRVPVVDLRPPDADDVSVAAVTDLAAVAAGYDTQGPQRADPRIRAGRMKATVWVQENCSSEAGGTVLAPHTPRPLAPPADLATRCRQVSYFTDSMRLNS